MFFAIAIMCGTNVDGHAFCTSRSFPLLFATEAQCQASAMAHLRDTYASLSPVYQDAVTTMDVICWQPGGDA